MEPRQFSVETWPLNGPWSGLRASMEPRQFSVETRIKGELTGNESCFNGATSIQRGNAVTNRQDSFPTLRLQWSHVNSAWKLQHRRLQNIADMLQWSHVNSAWRQMHRDQRGGCTMASMEPRQFSVETQLAPERLHIGLCFNGATSIQRGNPPLNDN